MTTVETKLEIIFVNKLYSKPSSKVISLDFYLPQITPKFCINVLYIHVSFGPAPPLYGQIQ